MLTWKIVHKDFSGMLWDLLNNEWAETYTGRGSIFYSRDKALAAIRDLAIPDAKVSRA